MLIIMVMKSNTSMMIDLDIIENRIDHPSQILFTNRQTFLLQLVFIYSSEEKKRKKTDTKKRKDFSCCLCI